MSKTTTRCMRLYGRQWLRRILAMRMGAASMRTLSGARSRTATSHVRHYMSLVLVALAAAGCSEDAQQPQPNPGPTPPPAVAAVVVAPGSVELKVGEARQMAATPQDAAGRALTRAVAWRSSNAAVAAVDASGNVQALTAGTATITAASEGAEGSANVVVAAVTPVLELSRDSLHFIGMAGILTPAPRPLQLAARNGAIDGLVAEITYLPGSANAAGWLTASLAAVAAPSNVTITAATGILLPGTYRARVGIRSITKQDVAPVHIDVTFVVEPGPELSITTANRHNCAVDLNGLIYCWGYNGSRQLGVGSTNTHETRPIQHQVEPRFLLVSTGELHACGISVERYAYCWGTGFMGDGNQGTGLTPRLVAGGATWKHVATGYRHTCALTAEGEAWCWGANGGAQVGNDTRADQTQPVRVSTSVRFVSLTGGEEHTCGVATDGDAYCWGRTAYGRLGSSITSTDAQRMPVKVPGDRKWASLAAGRLHTCGISTTGEAFCWGYNGSGQLGEESRTTRTSPTPVATGLRFTAIAAGDSHSCAIATSGQAYCWGYRQHGGVGDGNDAGYALVPAQVAGGHSFRRISVGRFHTCAVTTGDETYCWGHNATGAIGDGTVIDRLVPVRITLR